MSEDVLEEFGHSEVEVTTTKDLGDAAEMKAFVQPLFAQPDAKKACGDKPVSPKRAKLLQQIKNVKDEKKFKAFTPESEQNLVAELQLLRTLNFEDKWHKVNDSWVTALLPTGCLIHLKMRTHTPTS